MALPTYTEAIEKLTVAIREWNNTRLENELTPSEWFHTLKNDRAGQYTDRQYRRITGEMSKRDLSYLRSILTLERDGKEYKFGHPDGCGHRGPDRAAHGVCSVVQSACLLELRRG